MASEIRERERERKLEISRRKKIIAACRWATTAIVQSTNVCGGGGIRAFSLLRQVCFPFFEFSFHSSDEQSKSSARIECSFAGNEQNGTGKKQK